ncbi:MAG: tyrosine-type recombinase/integrase [Panacagrimonas sp.]
MKLTDAKVRGAAPRETPYQIADGGGLMLIVTPRGGKWWRFRYRFPRGGTQKMLSLGTYPEVPLVGREDRGNQNQWIDGARDIRDRMRRQLRDGIDPAERRKSTERARLAERANTFEGLWRDWLTHKKEGGHWGEASQSKATFYFSRDVIPKFRGRPVTSIERNELADFVRKIEERAPEAAEKIRGWLKGMFDYGMALGRLSVNPADKLLAVAKKKGAETPYAHFRCPNYPACWRRWTATAENEVN